MRIACLHASESNIEAFELAAAELGIPAGTLEHLARPDLLAAAEEAGMVTPEIAEVTAAVLLGLAEAADAVLLTCSTLGPAATVAAGTSKVPIIRADAALAAEAAGAEGQVVVLCAIEATLEGTRELFLQAGVDADARLVQEAWPLFRSGNLDAYAHLVAAAADDAYASGADLVVLGQASMAPAARLVTRGAEPPSTPLAGLRSVLAAVAGTGT